MSELLPERLNLAIARGCFVKCDGCYSLFGQADADLDAIARSAEVFAGLGIRSLTLSGGDPLTLPGLNPFLRRLRGAGFHSIKLDTVGSGLLAPGPALTIDQVALRRLAEWIDIIGVPLDGASNAAVRSFRRGRPALFDETLVLLDALQDTVGFERIVINTVVHRANLGRLDEILSCLTRFDRISDWSLFQYTSTDQADAAVNAALRIDDAQFAAACGALRDQLDLALAAGRLVPRVQFRSAASRFGDYLLVNSDAQAWLPDEHGRTLRLGNVIGREAEVLDRWRRHASRLLDLKATLPDWVPDAAAISRQAER